MDRKDLLAFFGQLLIDAGKHAARGLGGRGDLGVHGCQPVVKLIRGQVQCADFTFGEIGCKAVPG